MIKTTIKDMLKVAESLDNQKSIPSCYARNLDRRIKNDIYKLSLKDAVNEIVEFYRVLIYWVDFLKPHVRRIEKNGNN